MHENFPMEMGTPMGISMENILCYGNKILIVFDLFQGNNDGLTNGAPAVDALSLTAYQG